MKRTNRLLGIKMLLRMIVEWEDCGNDKEWWRYRYPSYSFTEVLEQARKRVKK